MLQSFNPPPVRLFMQQLVQRLRHSLLGLPQYRRLWCNFFIAEIGARISIVALPLLAITELHAGPFESGIMVACHAGAFGVSSLLAGVLADRFSPKRVLLGGQSLVFAALLSVPAGHALGVLRVEWLYVMELLIGLGLALIVAAGQVYAARIAGTERAIESNSLIFGCDSIAGLIGPGLAGWLVALLTPAWAISIDGLCIAISMLVLLPNPDQPGAGAGEHGRAASMLADFLAGWRLLWADPMLRLLTVSAAMFHVLFHGHLALHVLLATRTLGLSAGWFGMAMMFGGLGALAASLLTVRLARRVGERRLMVGSVLALAAIWLVFAAMPAASYTVVLFAPAVFAFDMMITSYSILFVSIRQLAAPPALLGRITSTSRFVAFSAAPLGGFGFGWVADHVGMRPTYALLGVLGIALAGGFGTLLRSGVESEAGQAAAG
ncbi:MFS transporter [Noviherbaspirillum galbum]|uniref:MFS transporter n=1 Tax=Noviherbaspirillum galbum TaxID=2709383 RepID=A0A6B3SWA8_9BURK|nr:MFS transporter [Noviherbaspirillum galbum]NEX63226.1 MFS transporter [Noviherbaspirillum galbum]